MSKVCAVRHPHPTAHGERTLSSIRMVLERLLEATGYTDVHSTGDPRRGLEMYAELDPDLTLLDLQMPNLHGMEVLREIASVESEPRAPVVIMTGVGSAVDVHRALELGAADFLHKPVDGVELLLRVRHQLRERRLTQELAQQNRQLEQLAEGRAGELALLSRVLDDIPVAALVLEADLTVRYANRLGSQLLAVGTGSLSSCMMSRSSSASPTHCGAPWSFSSGRTRICASSKTSGCSF